jgi:hypothetical protein
VPDLKVVTIPPSSRTKRRVRPFRPGDEVTVVGSPEVVLTVEESNPVDTACWWFDEMREHRCLRFPTVVLKKYRAPKNESE